MSYLSRTKNCVKFQLQVRAREPLVLWSGQDQTDIGNGQRPVYYFLCFFFFSFRIGGLVVGKVEGGGMGLVGGRLDFVEYDWGGV